RIEPRARHGVAREIALGIGDDLKRAELHRGFRLIGAGSRRRRRSDLGHQSRTRETERCSSANNTMTMWLTRWGRSGGAPGEVNLRMRVPKSPQASTGSAIHLPPGAS